ncbi:MAG: FAD/FMN-containing dehydrogenase [Halioglobus sp.]|jgi:FAD/FMN-containing dehydrogenase
MTDIIEAMQQILDRGGVLTGVDVSSRSGGWGEGPSEALAIVRPRNTEEVAAILKICHQHNQSVVTQGGKTGMVRGCVSSAGDIAMSMERMAQVEEIDTANGTMTVQAGVPLQVVQESAKAQGFNYPMDLGARGSATIGGNISTNAGGNRVIRYGMTRALVLGLEVVLADGTIVSSMNKMIKNNAGYDLKQLFIGSEGTLGIVTRAVLKLSPASRSQQTALVALNRFEDVTALLQYCHRGLGAQLCAFEVMWSNFFKLVTDAGAYQKKSPMNSDFPFYVLLESMGTHPDNDAQTFENVLSQALESELIEDAVIAKSESERDSLWEIRDNVEALNLMSPYYAFDISLPLTVMPDYLSVIEEKLIQRWPALRHVVFGHLGDGNLHVVVSIGSDSESERQAVEQLVYSTLETFGGSISAEHGIGLEKRDFLHHSRNEQEIALMHLLKTSLDPKNILNPGKVLNTTKATH